MLKDYTGNAETARRLVKKFGRNMLYRQLGDTVSDPAKPWKGQTDQKSTPEQEDRTLPTVPVDPDSARKLGMTTIDDDLLKRTNQILIVAPDENATYDLRDFNVVVDEGITYKVLFSERLRPATLTLLYFIGVGS